MKNDRKFMITKVKVNPLNEEHIELLYKLLVNRKFNISHKKNVSFYDHKIFVKNNPYRKWFLIFKETEFIGSYYCTYQNTIGINLKYENSILYNHIISEITSTIKPLKEIPSLRNEKFTINVPINNEVLKKVLIEKGLHEIQTTFIFN